MIAVKGLVWGNLLALVVLDAGAAAGVVEVGGRVVRLWWVGSYSWGGEGAGD